MAEKGDLAKYLVIGLICVGLVGLLFVLRFRMTGYAVYGGEEAVERGFYWNKIDNGGGSYGLAIYNSIINYYNGTEYVPIVYSSCGSNCFRDWNGLIYRVSSDAKKAYVELYDADDNYISSFGFGITGIVGGTNYKYTTLNFTWTWSQEHNVTTDEYIFRAYNNNPNFNWTQEFHFYPNQSMKIKNIIKNDLGADIQNTKFWFIQTVGAEDGIWFNGTKYNQNTYKTGEFDSLLPQVKFEEHYVFDYNDLLENGFNVTDFYLGDGEIIGVSGVRILAIGITKGNSVFSNGIRVIVDPTVKISGDGEDAYVKSNGDSDKNFGSLELLKTGDTARSYLLFNISAIPTNQKIDNASLCLYVLNTKKIQLINASHVYEDWDESTITWNNQLCGTGFDNFSACNLTAESFVQMSSDLSYTWLCWKVTNMIGKDYNDGNDDVAIVLYTGDSDINEFYSKEHSSSSLWPYLNITYHTANTAPSINIIHPESETYNYNESLPLNFTVSDSDDNLDSCWYNVNNGENVTLVNCQNTTFNISEGFHQITVYSNDSFGLETSDSVDFVVSMTGVLLSILEPSGTKSSRTGIPIQFLAIGDNLTCWYALEWSTGGIVIDNTTLINCSDASFDVSVDGNYILYLYANNSLGIFN